MYYSKKKAEYNNFVQLKNINAYTLINYKPCITEYRKFLRIYRYNTIRDFDRFIRTAKKQNRWLTFLLDHKFIRYKRSYDAKY